MKKTVFAIAVIVLILALGIGEQVYLRRFFDSMQHCTTDILQTIAADDLPEALQKTAALQEQWEARKHFLEAVVSHNETKEVTLRIAELRGYIAVGDKKSAYATASILQENACNLPHLLGFSWDTVL